MDEKSPHIDEDLKRLEKKIAEEDELLSPALNDSTSADVLEERARRGDLRLIPPLGSEESSQVTSSKDELIIGGYKRADRPTLRDRAMGQDSEE